MHLVDSAGIRKADVDTPALLLDLETFRRNVARISEACRANHKAWRPHTKGLKVPAIAHAAIASGAIGVTCAKLGEAEVMVAAGISDVLIANQIVGREKLARLAALSRHARITVALDDLVQAAALDEAASAMGAQIGVVIEVDLGIRRAGVTPGPAVPALAQAITRLPHLVFRGLMGWEGHACAILDPAEKEAAVVQAVGMLTASADLVRAANIPVEIVSCGGTGTYRISARQPGVTEIQAGGGLFGDVRYREMFGVEDLEQALTVLATIVSRPTPTRLVCDAGKKAMSEAVTPTPKGLPGVKSVALSAEHVVVEFETPNDAMRIGQKLEFIVGYEDTTVNLHDLLFGMRADVVEVVWPIAGRGKIR
jgi:D-serine deaminase-like pyridoxal phosphate-dependent protein